MLQDDTLLGGLYLIRLSDTHYYGGRTTCFKTRWKEHLYNLTYGQANNRMQNVYNKYGRFEPEIIEILPKELQMEAEQAWLDAHFRQPGCVNLSPYAAGGCAGHTTETKAKMRISLASDPERLRRAQELLRSYRMKKGFKHSAASIEKNRRGHIGIKQSPETIARRIASTTGLRRSPEIREKMSEAAKIRVQKYPIHFSDATRALLSERIKNLVWVNNGRVNTRVSSSDVPSYLDQGWAAGRFGSRSPESRALAREQSKDRIWLTDGDKNLFVKPDQVEALQADGWTQGRSNVKPTPHEARVKTGDKLRGRIWITNGEANMRADPDEIPPGWTLGLTKKIGTMSEEMKAAVSAKRRNKRWIYNLESGKNTSVNETDLPRYLDEGWALGRSSSAN